MRLRQALTAMGLTDSKRLTFDREVDILSGRVSRALGAQRIWAGWVWLLIVLMVAHLIAFSLDLIDRAAYQGVPQSLLGDLSDHPAWMVLHLVAAFGLAVSLSRGAAFRSWACNVSSAFLISWSALLLVVGLMVERGVSLLGPVFGILFAVVAQVGAQKFYAESMIEESAKLAILESADEIDPV